MAVDRMVDGMTWFRVDDSLPDHPKVLALQARSGWHGALALWTMAGAWCGRHLTDGEVPKAMVTRLGCTNAHAASLVAVGLWEVTETGYRFHQWSERNRLRAEVVAERERTKERVNKHRSNGTCNAVTGLVTNNVGTAAPTRPDPTRPDPTKIKTREPEAPDSADFAAAAAAAAEPGLGEKIRDLERKFNAPELLRETRSAIALSRKHGKISDPVWLTTLERLAALPVGAGVEAMRAFTERHADGDKSEAYLVGIARRIARGEQTPGHSLTRRAEPTPHEQFGHDDPDVIWGQANTEVANG